MAVFFLDAKEEYKSTRYLMKRLDSGVYTLGSLIIEIIN